MIIRWCDGLETMPNGAACRQLPQKHVWSSTVWCSADGVLWRRYYNPVSKLWTWADEPFVITIDEGKVGYMLDWWMSVDRVLALSWLMRAEGGSDRVQEKVAVQLVDVGSVPLEDGKRLDSIEWVDGEEGEEHVNGETWKPLKWRCGLIPCDSRYKISSLGRLWSPHTRTATSGFWYDGDRWAAVRGGALVPLHAAAGLQDNDRLQPRIRLAVDALMAGYAPSDLRDAGVGAESTCWSYFTQASQHVPVKELRPRAKKLVPPEVWAALERLKGDERLGGALNELIEAIRRSLPGRVLKREHLMSELRLARTAMTAL